MIYDPLVSVKSEFGQSSLSNRRFGSDESTESFSNKVQLRKFYFQKHVAPTHRQENRRLVGHFYDMKNRFWAVGCGLGWAVE